jgi:aminodeoxychorismate synthase component I
VIETEPLGGSRPFVLLDDARPGGAGASRLYRRPVEVIAATAPGEVEPALDRLRAALAGGLQAAGYLSYEAGAAFERRVAAGPGRAGAGEDDPPLLWFGLFEAADLLDPAEVALLLPRGEDASASPPEPLISRRAYGDAVEQAQAWIRAGDIYQTNLTFPAKVTTTGSPLALYARLRRARAGWGGVVFTGRHWLLSASPELFFSLDDGALAARPMKGTAPRGATADEDRRLAADLAADPKQRAENLMIVDLLRNDLSRVATSVATPSLFEVETYPTVHQMTSTVTARLGAGLDAIDVLRTMFPCGSVTGAPKIRAMQVITALEAGPRGPYTGSIGWLGPGAREAAFNVAIRTLVLRDGEQVARLGLGSAITADSRADDEWAECLTKGRFVTEAGPGFDEPRG